MGDENYDFDEEVDKKKGINRRMRNLAQYKGMSDEEFESAIAKKAMGINVSEAFEKKIQQKLDEFGEDYDLSDLKINDRASLRALIQAILSLEDYEQYQFLVRSGGLNNESAFNMEKLSKIMSDLRSDISKLQNDLNITRKIRKSDQDVSVMAYIDGLKEKAKKYYESKASYIFCPKCNMLLATIWTLYPENERNKFSLVCQRTMEDGTICGEKIVIGSKELLKNRGTSNKEITPESML